MAESTKNEINTEATAPAATETKRYAAYDKTLLKFVGGVHEKRADAVKAAKDRDVKNVEIREV